MKNLSLFVLFYFFAFQLNVKGNVQCNEENICNLSRYSPTIFASKKPHTECQKYSSLIDFSIPGTIHNNSIDYVKANLSYNNNLPQEDRLEELIDKFVEYVNNSQFNNIASEQEYRQAFDYTKEFANLSYEELSNQETWEEYYDIFEQHIPAIDIQYIRDILNAALASNENFVQDNQLMKNKIITYRNTLQQIKNNWNNEAFQEGEGEISLIILSVSLYSSEYWINNFNDIYTTIGPGGTIQAVNPGFVDAAGGIMGVAGGLITTHNDHDPNNPNDDPTWANYVTNAVVGGIVGGFTSSVASVLNVGKWLTFWN